jgi:hypothetical protein
VPGSRQRGESMIEKRFWSGAIAAVTLIVAGAGALPELLLRPASTGPSVALPRKAPKAEPIAPLEPTAIVRDATSVPDVNRVHTIAPPEQPKAQPAPQVVAAAPEPKPEPEVPAKPAPAPPVAFPPVQPVGVAAAGAPDVVPPARSQVTSASAAQPMTNKPHGPTAQRSTKPKQNVRPAAYPIGDFLAFRR